MQELNDADLTRLMSPYYLYGFKEDEVVIKGLMIEKGKLIANLRVNHLFYESKGVFYHFSALQAVHWFQQLGIIYARWDNSPITKMGTPRKISYKFIKYITKREFPVIVEILQYRKTNTGILYRMVANYDEGNIFAEGSMFLPFDEEVVPVSG
ncbi:MAG: hypothetical protein K0S08_1025 [Gammaproteobacteria bacterium]|nr:hypothetical protein [Gammaproteobacteria bacterium]